MTRAKEALVELLQDESVPNVAVQHAMALSDALDEADTKNVRERQESLEAARERLCDLVALTRITVRQI